MKKDENRRQDIADATTEAGGFTAPAIPNEVAGEFILVPAPVTLLQHPHFFSGD